MTTRTSVDVDAGRVLATTGEVQHDGTELEVVTEYVLAGIEDEMREDVVELVATFSFDPDVLMAAYGEG